MKVSRSINIPSEIVKRVSTNASASPTATDSNGCVSCSTDIVCPSCDSGEECLLTIQSCTECPKYYCKNISGGSSSSGPSASTIGGLAGGITGGLLVLIGVGSYLFYRFYFKKKLAFNRVQHKEFYFDDDIEINFRHNLNDSQNGPGGPNKTSSRNSLATTIFTRASNIIPIAYIPGVTIGANSASNNRASQYSEANTIDSDLVGDRYSKVSIIGNPSLTTTAIRAKPKLVSVHEVGGANNKQGDSKIDAVPSTAISAFQLGGVRSIKVGDNKKKYNPGLQTEILEEESDAESISQIDLKATDYEPFIIEEDEEDEQDEDTSGDTTTENAFTDTKSIESEKRDSIESNGSVLLEVEVDQALSPFDDTFDIDHD